MEDNTMAEVATFGRGNADAGSDTGEPCFWCQGGIMLPTFTNKTDQVCEICDTVDPFKVYWHSRDTYDPDIPKRAELGWIDEHASNTDCPFCRLIVHCLRETYGHGLPETFWRDGRIHGTRVNCYVEGFLTSEDGHDWKQNANAIGRLYFKTNPALDTLVSEAVDVPDLSRLQHSTAVPLSEGCMESRHRYMGVKRRRLWPEIDPGLAKEWLAYCERSHPVKSSHSFPVQIRVLDLEKGCLSTLPAGARYVTLSYVWGGHQMHSLRMSNKDEFYRPGFITAQDESLPLTIRDFLIFTSAIGERYVWIDSLCIIQDDQADVGLYVEAMDTIYENALVTIVAASGSSASHGLPGLRKGTRRMLQGREIFYRTAYGCPLPPLDEAILNSTWNERGWTYQEGILSSRMIVFTDCQMHFKCNRGCTACEETWEDGFNVTKKLELPSARGMHAYEPKMLTRLTPSDPYHGRRNNLWWWYEHVRNISARSTTNPKDRLHALGGILHHLEGMFDNHKFVWGHPSSALDISLLWRPAEMKDRDMVRNAAIDNMGVTIPSWSWAGWSGPIKFRIWNLCETAHSLVTWIDMTKDGPAEDRQFQVKTCGGPSKDWLSANKWVRLQDDNNLGSYYLRAGSEAIRYAHPVMFLPEEGPARAVESTTAELNFFAQTAEFSIPSEHLEARVLVTCDLEDCGNFKHICLFDTNGHVAGVVLADPSALKALNRTTFEFIAITNTTLTRVEWDQSYIEEQGRFLHLTDCPIVERNPDDPPVQHWNEYQFPLADPDGAWDFYESCWHPVDTVTCPYYDLKQMGERFCVSPFRSIHPTAGPFPFDPRYYSTRRPLPLNEVLLVERDGDMVQRLGVGYVHVDAWHKIAVEKHIRLR